MHDVIMDYGMTVVSTVVGVFIMTGLYVILQELSPIVGIILETCM